MPLPNLTDLKAHANSTDAADDAELQDMLDAAVGIVAGIVGPLVSETVTETHYGATSPLLVLRKAPVTELLSLSIQRPGGTVSTYLVDDYLLDGELGVVRSATGWVFSGDVTVSYTAGRADIPAPVSLAILVVAAHLWETQRGIAPTPLQLQQPDVGEAFAPGIGYAIPNRARELLAPYIMPSIA